MLPRAYFRKVPACARARAKAACEERAVRLTPPQARVAAGVRAAALALGARRRRGGDAAGSAARGQRGSAATAGRGAGVAKGSAALGPPLLRAGQPSGRAA